MISQLPAEILQHIASFLPASSAACFALSNKFYAFILGKQYFTQLHGMYCDRKELRAFLVLLEKDLPDQYGCLDCLRLHFHRPAVTRSRGLRQLFKSRRLSRGRECRVLDREGESTLFLNRKIGFEDLHTAVEEHLRNGSADMQLARLSATRSIGRLLPRLWTAQEFQIVDCGMLIRTVHQIRLKEKWQDPRELITGIYICSHFRTASSWRDAPAMQCNIVTSLIRQAAGNSRERTRSADRSRLYTCSDCYTEFEARCRRNEQGRYTMTFTSWKDLGNCESPFAARYRSHVSAWSGEWQDGQLVSVVQWTPGSIKAAWEKGKGDQW